MLKKGIRIISVLLSVIICICAMALPVFADNTETEFDFAVKDKANHTEYNAYLTKNTAKNATAPLEISVENYSVSSDSASVYEEALIWNDGKGTVSWSFSVPETALYNLEIVWKAMSTGVDITLGVKLDGEYPFAEAEKISLKRAWKNITEKPRTDAQGNEYAQEQTEIEDYQSTVMYDDTGITVEPYLFYLTQGEHMLTLAHPEQGIQIKAIAFTTPETSEIYENISKSYNFEKINTDIITIQGENADIKSSNSIIPKSNSSDAGMTPSDSKTAKINYIGGTSWENPGDKLVWKFSVEKAGYYALNIRYKQSDLVNGESWRWLKIDGKTPFDEAKSLKFPYGTGWKYYQFGEEEPYYIWLEKGEHTLSLEVTVGYLSEYFYRLKKVVDALGDEYIKIVMITSENPDINRDYELFSQIPNFTETLTENYESLVSLAKDMKKATGKNSTQAIAAMENMARVLNNMLKSPYIAQHYVKDYYNNYTSLSSWLYDMTAMPLAIDELQLVPFGSDYENKNAGFFKKLLYSVVRFLTSFTANYEVSSSVADNSNSTLRLWVNWGQDQTAVLNSIIEDSFTPKTGINVQLEIVSASLINGILAGNFPDLSLHMARTEPVNLGMRGALYDLKQFDDCNDVLERFAEGAQIPYEYKSSLYALPDTQSYYIMFYRTDIFEQLGLGVPTTWDEFLHAATIIQRNNMSVYVPYTQIVETTTVNAGIGNLNLYPTLLSQNNLSLYNKEKTATAITSKSAIKVFKLWTDFYTKYSFYKEADFYNRFRIGVMPLGIAPYSMYMTLYSAAPEIQSRWSIACVPGTVSKDGVLNRTIAGAGTGCAIIQKSSKHEEAWEFLKWWTSSETQIRYTQNVESILGMIGRTATANTNAFDSLSWNLDDLEVLKEQRTYVKEMPEVPGSYYLTRAIDQAYWSVVNGDTNSKDAVTKWSKVADDEIARKIKDYS